MRTLTILLLALPSVCMAALVSTGHPIDPDTAELPHWRVTGPDNLALIVEPDKTITFDAPTTLTVEAHTTGTLPVAIRITHIELRDSTTSLHWSSTARYAHGAYAWGTWQFDQWHPMQDDPSTRTMWINVVPPAVLKSPVRRIDVSERPNGLLDVQAISDKPNLKLYVDGQLQPISPTNKNTVETSSPFQWWEIRASQIPTLRVVAPDGTYRERVFFRAGPTPIPTPVGTATPVPTQTPAPTLNERLDAMEGRIERLEAAILEPVQ